MMLCLRFISSTPETVGSRWSMALLSEELILTLGNKCLLTH